MEKFAIYQLKLGEKSLFFNYDWCQKKGIKPNKGQYDLVYAGETNGRSLEDLYDAFNINHPEDFCGRSVSVSDVIEISNETGIHDYFVDSIGFVELPNF